MVTPRVSRGQGRLVEAAKDTETEPAPAAAPRETGRGRETGRPREPLPDPLGEAGQTDVRAGAPGRTGGVGGAVHRTGPLTWWHKESPGKGAPGGPGVPRRENASPGRSAPQSARIPRVPQRRPWPRRTRSAGIVDRRSASPANIACGSRPMALTARSHSFLRCRQVCRLPNPRKFRSSRSLRHSSWTVVSGAHVCRTSP
jgi:hypothetical protein